MGSQQGRYTNIHIGGHTVADTLLGTAVAGSLFSPVVPTTDKECDKDSYRLGEVTSLEYYSIFISLDNLIF